MAMLSRYPTMPAEEADTYIAKIEHPQNVAVCHAMLGRIRKEELDDDAKLTFDEFQRWSAARTRRTRNEQLSARYRREETPLAAKMKRLHEKGIIDDSTLLLFGISGDLPERRVWVEMTTEEKEALWAQRLEGRFGPNWRELVRELSGGTLFRFVTRQRRNEVNWLKEGF